MNCVVTELKAGTTPVRTKVSRPGGRVEARALRVALTCGLVAVASEAPAVQVKADPAIAQIAAQRDPIGVTLNPSIAQVRATVSEWDDRGFRNITLTAGKPLKVGLCREDDVTVKAKAQTVPFEFVEVCPISYVRSCFGAGYWRNDMAWQNDDAWDNGL